MRLMTSLAVLAGIFSASLATAEAQDYPTNPVTVIVPFAAGGPTDTVTRLVAESMSKTLGQQVIVENVGGAGGTLGAARAAEAEPDGYTLLLHHIGMATSATLYRKLPYDPKTAFAPVGLVTEVPMILVARKDFPASNLQELIAYVKEHKDEVTYANAGVGAASHLCGMLFMQAIETQMTTVPYKGTGPAMTDLLGGQVDLLCDQSTNTTGQIKGGEVKALFLRQARIELESIAQPGVHAVGPIEEDGSFTVATATAEGSGAGAVPGAHRVRLDLEDNAQKLVAPQFLDFLKSGIVIKVPSDQPIEVKVWR
jgi:tripartite-type tricarboxylate transporter receptor subunit TctC